MDFFDCVAESEGELLVAASCYAQQLQFCLCRCLAVDTAFGYILFGTAGRLYHLINGTVAVAGQIALAEHLSQLV